MAALPRRCVFVEAEVHRLGPPAISWRLATKTESSSTSSRRCAHLPRRQWLCLSAAGLSKNSSSPNGTGPRALANRTSTGSLVPPFVYLADVA